MATYGGTVRRGLPRTPGGQPWPPAGDVPADVAAEASALPPAAASPVAAPPAAAPVAGTTDSATSLRPRHGSTAQSQENGAVAPAPVPAPADAADTDAVRDSATTPQVRHGSTAQSRESGADAAPRALRRGLPRVKGGEPWPPAGIAPGAAMDAAAGRASSASAAVPTEEPEAGTSIAVSAGEREARTAAVPAAVGPASTSVPAPATAAASAVPTAPGETVAVRRGLPRVKGGEPWPPADFTAVVGATTAGATTLTEDLTAPAAAAAAAPAAAAPAAPGTTAAPAPATGAPTAPAPPPATTAASAPAQDATAMPAEPDVSVPLPFTPTVWQGPAARRYEEQRRSGVTVVKPEPKRIGMFTRAQWAGIVVVGGGALLFAAAMAVLIVRWLLSTEWGMGFLEAFPGEYHLPEGAPVGFPAWLGWQHFFNVFLMVLIIRTGLQVRTEKRPSVFWTPRGNPKGKISLTLWFHQALDILWLVNGVIFVVLLFATGQWMRVIPTSWEVFPNAISAVLQYISLDWPTENGWVNYNSIQQIAYFTTIFIAAPLAAVTGFRMSGLWPKKAKRLSAAYPIEWARAVHFPVMLYFVAFIIVHVLLVFATGALRNLNHMYAAQGSVDPNAYASNWTGFWLFVVSLAVIIAAWIAARPITLAPLARLFGNVSGR